jgi:hypothetical protein
MQPCFGDPTTPPPTEPEAACAKNPPSSLSQPTPSSRPDARSTALTPCLKTRFRVTTGSDDWVYFSPAHLGERPQRAPRRTALLETVWKSERGRSMTYTLGHERSYPFPARDRDAFMANWTKIPADEGVIKRTVLLGGAWPAQS